MTAGDTQATRPDRRIRVSTYVIFLAFFALLLFITHLSFLRLPYFWDEAAQFVPWALDFYHSGSLVATSVKPNIHPPLVIVYLAGVWKLVGFSTVATRSAMLLISAFGLLAAFLLAIELSQDVRGMPAFLAVVLLFVSPLFFAQSMLAQLDAPAMLLTALALLCFLQDRVRLSALACVALVLTKETGVVAPLVFGYLLARERRWGEAGYFLAPLAALAAWIVSLYSVTGSWAGNAGFAHYNLSYPLEPSHIALAVGRRLYFLFVADFRWIGTIAVVTVWRHGHLRSRAWQAAFLLLAAQAAVVTLFGGAVLERYLLPVMPVVFAAIAAALSLFRVRQRVAASLILLAASAAGNLINPPYPFPFENNLAFTDFLTLQSDAAEYLSHWYPRATVTTAWPLTMELRHPELGFVPRRFDVKAIPNFTPVALDAANWKNTSVVVVFARYWDPPHSFMRLEPVRWLWGRFYGFAREAGPEEARGFVPFALEQRLQRRGLWLDIYVSPQAPRGPMQVQTAAAPEAGEWRRTTGIPRAESFYAPRPGMDSRVPAWAAPAGSTETPRCVRPVRLATAAAARWLTGPDPEWKLPETRR
ncbi:MAG TPA: glycosyltransferase family 39 protein [Bryobacteraceae bacterium]|nr:glycosyltransferase family 39 protein [Bryobacteraceae bacterium]